jgi:MoaA/NifB/PqqE/SkfB family radical SAM enzyme
LSALAPTVIKTWERDILFSVLIELTYRCNLDCFFCYNDVKLKGKPLGRDQYFAMLEDLAAMQVWTLVLSGGEPLSHPDFLAIGEAARERGFVVRLKTNGHALRGALLRAVRERMDPFVIEISLHGASAAVHDRQTRVPGSFERLVANLREAREAGLRIKLNSTLTAWNEAEIEGMFALAESLGLPLNVDPEVTPRDDGSREPQSIAASLEGIRRLYSFQDRRAASLPLADEPPQPAPPPTRKHCGAGSSGLAIDPFGNVYPCVQWRRPVGNLHERSIREIWTGSPALSEVRALTVAVKERLQREPAAGFLNFCPGNAESATGSPLAIYPAAALRRRVLLERAEEAKAPPA